MNEIEYRRWWQLHLRVAKGETLSPQEQIVYQAGIRLLDQEEENLLSAGNLALLRRLRSQVQALSQLHTKLASQSEQLNERIAFLEQAYKQLTGYELALDSHATS